jgi:nitrilase
MADGEQIHSAMYPDSFAGELFAEQMQVNIRQHALEAGCFRCQRHRVAGRRSAGQGHERRRTQPWTDLRRLLHRDRLAGRSIGEPIHSGEGVVIADLDFALIDRRKHVGR